MRVCHLSTFRSGGAAVAALRLHESLNAHEEIDSFFCSLAASSNEDGKSVQLTKYYPNLPVRLLHRAGLEFCAEYRENKIHRDLGLNHAPFSIPRSDVRLLEQVSSLEPDIIHLHWVSGLLDWSRFFSKCQIPLVWTLHDMNPFLGGFHYTCDAEKASAEAQELDASLADQKSEILAKVNSLHVTAPSQWLAGESQSSECLGRFEHSHIPYGIDTNRFRPFSKELSRGVFGIPEDAKILLMVAEDLRSFRKGGDLLVDALAENPLSSEWVVISVGRGDLPVEGYPHYRLGSISDERLMALAYSAADLTAITTRQDNLPNVVIESLCCGTPVVGTPCGGVPEMIKDGRNGCLADEISAGAVAKALAEAGRMSFSRDEIRKDAVEQFDSAKASNRFEKLYRSILSQEGSWREASE